MQPKTAHKITNNNDTTSKIEEVPLEKITVGDKLLILPGERIPVDGVLLSPSIYNPSPSPATPSTNSNTNSSNIPQGIYVDESMLSGESLPVLKEFNQASKLFAGSLNITQGYQQVCFYLYINAMIQFLLSNIINRISIYHLL